MSADVVAQKFHVAPICSALDERRRTHLKLRVAVAVGQETSPVYHAILQHAKGRLSHLAVGPPTPSTFIRVVFLKGP